MKARMGHSPAGSRIGAALVAAALLAPGVRARAESYTVTPIAPRAVFSHHYSINDRGQVAGRVNVSGTNRAFRWTPTVPNATSGALVTLGPPKGTAFTLGHGMNSLGDVVGIGGSNSDSAEGLLWPANGGVVGLGGGSARDRRDAWAVNTHGDVALTVQGAKPGLFISRLVGGKQKLFQLYADYAKAMDLNDSGQVLGYSSSQLWTPTSATTWSLQTVFPGSGATGHDLNENGDVAGQASNSDGHARPLLYLPAARYGLASGVNDLWDTVVAGLGSPAAGAWRSGNAFGVNDLGVVVGRATAQDAGNVTTDMRAWIWDQNLGLRDLSAVVAPTGWTLTNGWHRINNAGQIVTTATDGTAEYCVLLTPGP